MEERNIKMHLDEEMRAHIEFVLRRYYEEFWFAKTRKQYKGKDDELARQVKLTAKCLKEAEQAGT